MHSKQFVLGALVAGMTGLLAGSASAQEAAPAAEPSLATSASEPAAIDEGSEESKDPMGWIGLGLKLGVAGNGEGEFETSGVTGTIDSRTGFNLALAINMGGDGFGWLIEPYLNLASVEGVDAVTLAKKDYGVTTFGLYTGPSINIHIMDPLYIAVGAGLKLGYSSSDAFDLGLDVFGRVPVTGTYYIMDDVAAVAELGLGYGVTGFASVPNTVDTDPDVNFGSALTWDFSVGARWP
jgi:hypothetical protein